VIINQRGEREHSETEFKLFKENFSIGMSRPTPQGSGVSTRAVKRVNPEEGESGQSVEEPTELSEPAERPLTASIFQQTMERFTENLLRQQLELQAQQQRFMQQLSSQLIGQRMEQSEPLVLNVEPLIGVDNRHRENAVVIEGGITDSRSQVSANGNQGHSGVRVSWLATQIPEFGGTHDESANQWIRRMYKMAQVHGATDGVVLLAASSKLAKNAKK